MKKHFQATLLFISLCLLQSSTALASGTWTTTSYYSEALGETRNLSVYLPEGYNAEDEDTIYPVVYFLHGGYVNQNSYPMLKTALDETIWTGTGEPPEEMIHPVILAAPDGNSNVYGGLSWWTDSELHGQFRQTVVTDLIAHMDSEYNTIADGGHRAVLGHSMGGFGAMSIALRHPDLFRAVATHGGVIDFTTSISGIFGEIQFTDPGTFPSPDLQHIWTQILYNMSAAFSPATDNPSLTVYLPIDGSGSKIDEIWELWKAFDPSALARSLTPATQPAMCIQIGLDDELWLPVNRAFRDSIQALGLEYQYFEHEGDHNNALGVRFPVSLRFFDEEFERYDADVDAHHSGMLPDRFELKEPFPNPFNPSTTITVHVHEPAHIKLGVMNILGQPVVDLEDGILPAGQHSYTFDATGLASGLYFIRVENQKGESQSRRIVLIQ